MSITTLPHDVFLLINDYLSPSELILCRCVSKAFFIAFTEPNLNRKALQCHFPRARETRESREQLDDGSMDWGNIFAKVASRYHYLKSGKPRSSRSLPLAKSLVAPAWSRYYPVAPWDQYLSFQGKFAPFHYTDPLWTYEDGILIFPCATSQSYVIYEVITGTSKEIDLVPQDRVVRRIRLKDSVLVVEWCENQPYKASLEYLCHRYYGTAYDLSYENYSNEWSVVFRNEWKLNGQSPSGELNSTTRFYSAHSMSHYAIYWWWPGTSENDSPSELLEIFDISTPSLYRPSEAPSESSNTGYTTNGPTAFKQLLNQEFEFYDIRQGSTPNLRQLEVDENHVYFVEEDHRWLIGSQASQALPTLHKVKSTGIPFAIGPRWADECGADGDLYRSFCERTISRHPSRAPCWRHEEFPYLTVSEVIDGEAEIKFSARHVFSLEAIAINVIGHETLLQDDLWSQLLGKGKICGDERWLIGENGRQEIVILYFDRKPSSHGV